MILSSSPRSSQIPRQDGALLAPAQQLAAAASRVVAEPTHTTAADDASDIEIPMTARAVRIGLVAGVACTAVVTVGTLVLWPTPAGGASAARTVSIYAPRAIGVDCARVYPLPRHVAGPRILLGAMQALMAGPMRGERARGYGGWFSAKTAGHLRSIRLVDARTDRRPRQVSESTDTESGTPS